MSAEARALPAWEKADLPAPPRFSVGSAIAIIGPGAILLGTSIGSGEWLIGPAVTARYGGALLWVASTSIILQVVMNMEFARYTMYTGEPIFTGYLLQLGWRPARVYVLFGVGLVVAAIATLLLDLTYRGRSEDPETPEAPRPVPTEKRQRVAAARKEEILR